MSVTALLAGEGREVRMSAADLSQWSFFGEGLVAVDAQAESIVLAESPGSKGVMLVSPISYPENYVLSYKVRPLTPESVLVVMLAASDIDSSGKLSFPQDYDGNMGYVVNNLKNYFIAFHNAAHNATPFIWKHGKESADSVELIRAESNVMSTRWHAIELGRRAGKLWLKIDGKLIVEATEEDASGLARGHLIFRIRGTADRVAVAQIRDVNLRFVE